MNIQTLFGLLVALVIGAFLIEDFAGQQDDAPMVQLASDEPGNRLSVEGASGTRAAPRFFQTTNALMGGNTMNSAGGDPADAREAALAELRGIVSEPNGTRHDPDAIFTSFTPGQDGRLPKDVEVVAATEGCDFRLPAEGERVIALTAADERPAMPIYGFDRATIAYDIELQLTRALGGTLGDAPSPDVPKTTAFHLQDVAVTETERPVYLILQSPYDNTGWALHLAPGARVAHVVLLARETSGVMNLPEGTGIEGLNRAGLAECAGRMSFPPGADAVIHDSVRLGLRDAEAELAAWKVRDREWQDWMRATFDVPAGFGPLRGVVHALVAGPVPGDAGARAEYASVRRGTLHMLPVDHVLVGDDVARPYTRIVNDYAEAIAGADLSSLAPVLHVRTAENSGVSQ